MSNKRTDQRTRTKSKPVRDHSAASSSEPGLSSSDAQSSDSGTGSKPYRPQSENKPADSVRGRRSAGPKFLLAAVAALAVAVGAYMAIPGGDNVSEQESQIRSSEYQAFLASSRLPLDFVSAQDMDKAFDSMPESVSNEQKQELKTQVDSGQVRLAWLSLWDTHAEDGDILRFESAASFPIEVMALNQKTTIAIPYPVNGEVLVTGVKDGGGGITIALESGATQISWPTMQEQDQLRLPVTPGF